MYENDVTASLGFKTFKKKLKKGAIPTIINTNCANAQGIAVRQDRREAGPESETRQLKLRAKRQAAQRKADLLMSLSDLQLQTPDSQVSLTSRRKTLPPKRRASYSDSESVGVQTDLVLSDFQLSPTTQDPVTCRSDLQPVMLMTQPLLSCGHRCITCEKLHSRVSHDNIQDHGYAVKENSGTAPLKHSTPVKCGQSTCVPSVFLVEAGQNSAGKIYDLRADDATDFDDMPVNKEHLDLSTSTAPTDPADTSYNPQWDESDKSDDADIEISGPAFVQERKYVVFDSCLDNLFSLLRCPIDDCNSIFIPEDTQKDDKHAMLLKCHFLCLNGHSFVWFSQPMVGKICVGNLLSCVSVVMCGQTYTHIAEYAKFFGLNFLSEPTFYRMQKRYLIPVILKTWKEMQDRVLQQLKARGSPLHIPGDGRCDSPGYSGKYCTYTVIDLLTSAVVAFIVVDVTETGSSVRMEVKGFQDCLEYLFSLGFQVEVFASDRHVHIRSILKKEWGEIDHQFDVGTWSTV